MLNSNDIKVSVIMMTYAHEKYIKQAIYGVLMQECNFEVELIVANDCSPDKTDDVIKGIIKTHPNSSWIKYIHHEHNNGPQDNFVLATQQCKGEYIALCEGDDYWTDPYKLQKQVDFLEENGGYVACFTNAKIINEIDNIQSVFVNGLNEGKVNDSVIGISGGALYPTCSLLFRMSNFKAKLFLDIPELAGDDLLILSLAQQGSVFFLNYETCVYRRHPSGVFSSISKIDLELVKVKKKNIVGYSKLVKRREFQKFKKELKRKISLEKLFILKYDNSFNKFQYFFSMHYKELIKYCLGKN